MENGKTLFEKLKEYTQRCTAERPGVQPLLEFLERNTDENLYNRKNFDGHITASAFIVDKEWKSLLMIHHKSLNRWLQPGGHIEPEDTSLLVASLREAVEETGISMHSITPASDLIFDVDSHAIPANTKKNEPAHIHHDARFLFIYTSTVDLNINPDEVIAAQWIPIVEVSKLDGFHRVADKILQKKLLAGKVE